MCLCLPLSNTLVDSGLMPVSSSTNSLARELRRGASLGVSGASITGDELVVAGAAIVPTRSAPIASEVTADRQRGLAGQ
eukprot:SAG25_NODE_732_length_5666_cov_1.706125_3_plen_79_part_00